MSKSRWHGGFYNSKPFRPLAFAGGGEPGGGLETDDSAMTPGAR